ncbi:Elongation of very long chain fatty acids protein AAEL008004, partial [Geodia barretti]
MDLLSSYWEGAKARYETAMNNGDPRVADWFLMDSPFPTLALCLAYLGMCYAGPRMMANREPFQLRPVIIVYNLVMVLVSAYMCYEVVKS